MNSDWSGHTGKTSAGTLFELVFWGVVIVGGIVGTVWLLAN